MNAPPSTVPLPALAAWCRTLKHGIGAGLSPVRVFRHQARSGPGNLRGLAAELADRMETGVSLEDALEPHRRRFPPLFVELVAVGEGTGRLEDVFDELAVYYETAWQTQREFRQMMVYPVMQFTAAVLVLALLIWVLGMISEGKGGRAPDPLGIGLSGTSGALTFLGIAGGLAAAAYFGFRFLTQNATYRARMEGFGLRVPVWGPALLAFALQRFCLALRISHEAGLSADRAVRYAFRATANAAFQARASETVGRIKKGKEMAVALARGRAPFPEAFLGALTLAETTGQITEVLDRLADNYREDGIRQMKRATQLTGYAVYVGVGTLIVAAIFKLATGYIGAITSAI